MADSINETNALAQRMTQTQLNHMKESCQLGSLLFIQGEDSVLLCLYHHKRALLSGEIMEKTGLTTGRIANILKQLERKRLIERVQDAGDKRRVHVSLTESGAAQAAQLYQESEERFRKLFTCLGLEDSQELMRIIDLCLLHKAEKKRRA